MLIIKDIRSIFLKIPKYIITMSNNWPNKMNIIVLVVNAPMLACGKLIPT